MGNQWESAAAARTEFADLIEALDEGQLDTPTMSGGWTPRHLLGHLVAFVDMPQRTFMLNLTKNGFNYDKAADKMARNFGQRPVAELVATLRANAHKPSAMKMFPEEMTLTDVLVHTQDLRRSLGLDGDLAKTDVRTALKFLTTHKMAKNLIDPKVVEGLHLEATDLDWRHGSGACVEGTGEALMMAMCGRPVLDELAGIGVDEFRSRLS